MKLTINILFLNKRGLCFDVDFFDMSFLKVNKYRVQTRMANERIGLTCLGTGPRLTLSQRRP